MENSIFWNYNFLTDDDCHCWIGKNPLNIPIHIFKELDNPLFNIVIDAQSFKLEADIFKLDEAKNIAENWINEFKKQQYYYEI